MSQFIKIIFIAIGLIIVGPIDRIFADDPQAQKTIICFGASLTAGDGAEEGFDYPSQLAQMVNIPVINAGVRGNSTQDELQRLQEDVLQKNPKIVVITQRLNDLTSQIPRKDSLNNLEAIIDQIQDFGAKVVLVTFEVQEFKETYFKDIRNLAKRKHVLIIPDVLKGIESDPQYMHDKIHPNNQGYKVIAQRIFKEITPLLK